MNGKYLTFIGTAIALALTSNVAVAQSTQVQTAQSSGSPSSEKASEIKLSPRGMEILCKNYPLNSRCQGTSADATQNSSGGSRRTPSDRGTTTSPESTTTPGTSNNQDTNRVTPGTPGSTTNPIESNPETPVAPGTIITPSGTTGTPDGTGTTGTPNPDGTGTSGTTNPDGTGTGLPTQDGTGTITNPDGTPSGTSTPGTTTNPVESNPNNPSGTGKTPRPR